MMVLRKTTVRVCSGIAMLTLATAAAPARTTTRVQAQQRLHTTATTTYKVVNLSTLLGGGSVRFIPTALNNLGEIAGYDAEVVASTNDAGAAYVIDANDTVHVLQNTGVSSETYIPLAISSSGSSVAGEGTSLATPYLRPQSGPSAWSLAGSPGSYRMNFRRYTESTDPNFRLITGLTNGTLAVGGPDYYSVTRYAVAPFPTSGCPLGSFFANAVNDAGTIVGSAGGYAATDTVTGCSAYIAGLPRARDTSTAAIAINAGGALILSIQGRAAPAYGSYYLVAGASQLRVTLPANYSSATYYVSAVALSDADAVVGNIMQQAPPFTAVAPFLYQNGRSIDVNTLLPAKSGWRLVTAAAIDKAGEIVGTGYYGGVLTGYALLP